MACRLGGDSDDNDQTPDSTLDVAISFLLLSSSSDLNLHKISGRDPS